MAASSGPSGSAFRELVETNYDFPPETTHFLQLEEPEECARLTIEFLEAQGLA